MGGDISVRMVGTSAEKRDVELTSHGGTVTLTVPKDFPMDVRITLAYTKNAPRTYEIVDHAGLEKRETSDWDMSNGSPASTFAPWARWQRVESRDDQHREWRRHPQAGITEPLLQLQLRFKLLARIPLAHCLDHALVPIFFSPKLVSSAIST